MDGRATRPAKVSVQRIAGFRRRVGVAAEGGVGVRVNVEGGGREKARGGEEGATRLAAGGAVAQDVYGRVGGVDGEGIADGFAAAGAGDGDGIGTRHCGRLMGEFEGWWMC